MGAARTWIFVYSTTKLSNVDKKISVLDSSRNVLLIGGAGYIGSALIRRLLDNNYKVKVLDVLLFGSEPIAGFRDHPSFELVSADFRKVDEKTGEFQNFLRVYECEGKPCISCGMPIQRIVQQQRSSYFCPGCQI